MFENIYALTNNYSQNTVFSLDTPTLSAIDDSEISANESFIISGFNKRVCSKPMNSKNSCYCWS
jgi:hypothetical protein